MQREEAFALLDAFLVRSGYEAPEELPEDEEPWTGMSPEVAFRFFDDTGELRFYAPVYTFAGPVSAEFLELCRQEAESGTAEMGGGSPDFDQERNTLYLARTYTEPVALEQLNVDVLRLQDAALEWDDEVLDRIHARMEGAQSAQG